MGPPPRVGPTRCEEELNETKIDNLFTRQAHENNGGTKLSRSTRLGH